MIFLFIDSCCVPFPHPNSKNRKGLAHSEDELKAYKERPDAWTLATVVETLEKCAKKGLQAEGEGHSQYFSPHAMFANFALVGLCRVKVLTCDYTGTAR